MRFAHILELVYSQPWLVTPSAHNSIRELLDKKLAGVDMGSFEAPDPEGPEDENGIRIIPCRGVLGKGLSAIEKSCGACDVEDLIEWIDGAESDESCKGVLLEFDSPGGSVSGIPELARCIREMKKPCVAWVDGLAASAAYWAASQCDSIYTSESGTVGSIGVYMPWMDQTRRYEAAGVKVEIIKNTEGTFKAAGYPGTSLTPEQRDELQKQCDQIYSMFAGDVSSKRKKSKAESMQGQTFMGAEAFRAGLVDGIVSWGQAMNEVRRLAKLG